MKPPYVLDRLREAAEAAAIHDGDPRDALYLAHLCLHTVQPEQLPEGELRDRLTSIHDRLTKRRPTDLHEDSVIAVIRRLGERDVAALIADIEALHARAAVIAARLEPTSTDPASGTPPSAGLLKPAVRRASGPGSVGRILIVFGSTEGHVRSLAEFMSAQLTGAGYSPCVRAAVRADEDINLNEFAAVIVAASVHWGRYQSSVTEFVKRHQLELNAAPSALVSVSLAAAGVRQPRGMTLEACVAGLSWETRWSPDEVHHAGGRIRHNGYDYFRGLAVSLIAAARGDEVNIQGDYDLTDYHALDRFILGFARRYAPLPARTKGEGRTVPSVGRLGPDRPES